MVGMDYDVLIVGRGIVGLAHALEGIHVSDVMTQDCTTVESSLNIQDFVL